MSYTLSVNGHTIATHALIDSGATGIAFIDKNFAYHHQLPLVPFPNPRSLEVIDGHPISSGDITHTTTVKLSINKHQEELPIFVTQLGHYPIVLGIPWMDLHDIIIRFHSCTATFGSQYCSTHCTPFPIVAHRVAPEKLSNPAGVCSSSGTVSLVSNVAQKCKPAVSAGASDIEAQIFTSHSNFEKIKVVNHQAKSDTKPYKLLHSVAVHFGEWHTNRNSLFSRSPYMKSTLCFNQRKTKEETGPGAIRTKRIPRFSAFILRGTRKKPTTASKLRPQDSTPRRIHTPLWPTLSVVKDRTQNTEGMVGREFEQRIHMSVIFTCPLTDSFRQKELWDPMTMC